MGVWWKGWFELELDCSLLQVRVGFVCVLFGLVSWGLFGFGLVKGCGGLVVKVRVGLVCLEFVVF